MKPSFIPFASTIWLLLAILCGFSRGYTRSNVITLDRDTVSPFIAKNEVVFLMIHAEWCGHCRNAKPELEKLSVNIPGGLKIAMIDGDVNREISKHFNVTGFPKFLLFKKGQNSVEYRGARKQENFASFLKTQLPYLDWKSKKSTPHTDL